jgi:ABC-type dipeptide/oligopeptide/nickel transport system permease component
LLAVFLAVSMVVFALISLPEGDPALAFLGDQAWVQEAKALNRGIDPSRPAPIRYAIWLGRVLRRLRDQAVGGG